jgi:hypothetical protein
MKKSISIFLFFAFVFVVKNSQCQTEKCDTIYESPEKEASFKNGGHDLLQFFNNNFIQFIYEDNPDNLPPTSFKMILIINDNDEVERIDNIRGDYSEKTKKQILEILKNEKGWKSGEMNGQKVCSKFYFVIGCIMLD